MHYFLKKTEYFVDRAIPFALLILLVLIILELFFHDYVQPYLLILIILDYTIITLFWMDLFFKYRRSKSFPGFLRSSWLDIIAVFPFFLFFRLFESLAALVRTGETVQPIVHEIIEAEKLVPEASKLARESKVIKVSSSILRPLVRIPRLMKALQFYHKPD